MASINYAAREISVKIVYYGPGLSGKTTNLQIIHKKIPKEYKSDMVSLATETDRTLFFDFLPLDLGKIKGFSAKFQLYTVPGQVYYNATRKLVLRGVDGIVFVADSSPQKIQENIESYQNMEENLAEYGYKRENVSITIQYNKRDLPNAMTIDELNRTFNKHNLPFSEAIANKGQGVFESLKMIGKIVIDALNQKYSRQTSKTTTGGPRIPMPPKSLPPIQSAPLPPQQMPPMQRQAYAPPPPPPLSPPPIQRQQQTPAYQEPFNPFVDNYGAATVGRMPAEAPPSPPPSIAPRIPTAAPSFNKDYGDFNTIPLQPMNETSWSQPPYQQHEPPQAAQQRPVAPQQPPAKSGLDLEIERYEREIQERPAAVPQPFNSFANQAPQFQPQQQAQQQPINFFPPPPPPQQMPQYPKPAVPSFSGEANFEIDVRQGQSGTPYQQPTQFPSQQFQQFGQSQFGQQQPEMDASFNYQGPQGGMGMQNNRPQESPSDNPMYFTSVNMDKSKKKLKKPINPKNKPKGGLFGKMFGRDEE
jgi:signal recognition particle receptor subunit beta